MILKHGWILSLPFDEMSCYYYAKHNDYLQAKNSVLDTDLDRSCYLGWESAATAAKISQPLSLTEGSSAAAADKLYVPANDDESNSIDIYKRVSPAVVNITSTTVDFDFFFNAMPKQGSGSGSMIDTEGHILTNYHVIEGARVLEVTLADRRNFKAKPVGVDPSNDLAVIKIEPGRNLFRSFKWAARRISKSDKKCSPLGIHSDWKELLRPGHQLIAAIDQGRGWQAD